MRHALLLLALLATAAASPPKKPVPQDAIDSARPADWKEIPADDLLVMTLDGGGKVVVQLAPAFAPVHAANIRRLAASDYWKGAAVYRVQDNYVAQWGIGDAVHPFPAGVVKLPPAEYWRSAKGLNVTPLGSSDSYAPRVGFAGGWPVALEKDGTANLTHCYGYVGVARDLAPDTGTGAELYAIIGNAPRALDRNIAVVGRVIQGIDLLSSLPRGSEKMGFFKGNAVARPIVSMVMASSLAPADRPRFEYLDDHSAAFARYLHLKANRNDDFFRFGWGGVDLCNAPVPVRPVPAHR